MTSGEPTTPPEPVPGELDDAMADTFPASDPPAITQPKQRDPAPDAGPDGEPLPQPS